MEDNDHGKGAGSDKGDPVVSGRERSGADRDPSIRPNISDVGIAAWARWWFKATLPFVQLPAVALTGGLAAHKGLTLFFPDVEKLEAAFEQSMEAAPCGSRIEDHNGVVRIKDCGPVLKIFDVVIEDAVAGGVAKLIAKRQKYRDDCSIMWPTWQPGFFTPLGWRVGVEAGFESGVDLSPGIKEVVMSLQIPGNVPPGIATFDASFSYACPEGNIKVEYPAIEFEILAGKEAEY